MAKGIKIEFHKEGWDALIKGVVETVGVSRMSAVAAAANSSAGLDDGYRVSVEGDDPLQQHDYRATVITATGAAMSDNMKNNTLVNNFHVAGGE